MALKDIWVDKIDGQDDVVAKDINDIAHSVIGAENELADVKKSIVGVKEDLKRTSDVLNSKSVSGSIISVNDVSTVKNTATIKAVSNSSEDIRVSLFSKNLIPYPFNGFTESSNGITATDLGDGGVLLNGTATASTFIYLHKTPIGNLFIEGTRTFDMGGTKYTITANRYSDAIRTVHHNNNHLTYIIITAGTVCDNIVFYPQIEVGSTETEFEKGIPYQSFVLKSGETVDALFTSSTMTVMSDVNDAEFEVKYNKDINKVIENLTNAIISLGGNV